MKWRAIIAVVSLIAFVVLFVGVAEMAEQTEGGGEVTWAGDQTVVAPPVPGYEPPPTSTSGTGSSSVGTGGGIVPGGGITPSGTAGSTTTGGTGGGGIGGTNPYQQATNAIGNLLNSFWNLPPPSSGWNRPLPDVLRDVQGGYSNYYGLPAGSVSTGGVTPTPTSREEGTPSPSSGGGRGSRTKPPEPPKEEVTDESSLLAEKMKKYGVKPSGSKERDISALIGAMNMTAKQQRGYGLTQAEIDKLVAGLTTLPAGGAQQGVAGQSMGQLAMLLNSHQISEQDAYKAALAGGFQGSFRDFLVTKDAIIHQSGVNRGREGPPTPLRIGPPGPVTYQTPTGQINVQSLFQQYLANTGGLSFEQWLMQMGLLQNPNARTDVNAYVGPPAQIGEAQKWTGTRPPPLYIGPPAEIGQEATPVGRRYLGPPVAI